MIYVSTLKFLCIKDTGSNNNNNKSVDNKEFII